MISRYALIALVSILAIFSCAAVALEIANSEHTLEILGLMSASIVLPAIPVLLSQRSDVKKTVANTEEIMHKLNGDFEPRVEALVERVLDRRLPPLFREIGVLRSRIDNLASCEVKNDRRR